MEEPVSTPKLPPPAFKAGPNSLAKDQQFSSSPGFGTPAYPIQPRPPPVIRQAFAPQQQAFVNTGSSVLPVQIPPQTLRPVAFRTLTKKHNLTLTSSGLGLLSTFIGRYCGSGWREEGLAERALDEIAKAWKRQSGGVIVEDGTDKKLSAILKSLEPCMSGGRVDVGRLSRTSSSVGGPGLSRQGSLIIRPEASREDSQTSLGFSSLDVTDDVEMEEEDIRYSDARPFLKVVSAFKQPRLAYSLTKKTIETVPGDPTLLPPIQNKIAMFRNRYHLIHQRLLRNESFQTSSVSSSRPPTLSRSGSSMATMSKAYKITPISNLLGRSGSSFLLLGLLSSSATGDLALTDLSGSVVLDVSEAQQLPRDSAWVCPGMIVLLEGIYEEDGSNNSNLGGAGGVGGQIKGRFVVDTIAGPPPEKREVTLAVGQDLRSDHAQTSVGAGFGWVDFLGVGSEKAIGSQMRRLQKRILGSRHTDDQEPTRSKVVIVGECHLDSPRTLEAIKAILNSYLSTGGDADRPLAVVLMGNFVSAASMAGSAKGGGSVEYKEHFDALASTLSEFPQLLSSTSFIFVPGDNDPWASSFSAGAATLLPRNGIPELFTSRIRRAIATANNEAGRKSDETPGEAIWASNPARISVFGPLEEIVLFRDDISSRLRRNSITVANPSAADDEANASQEHQTTSYPDNDEMDMQPIHEATSHLPTTPTKSNPNTSTTSSTDSSTPLARRLTKTLLDQSHLSPFPLSLRPTLWDFSASLSLYPLPTALVLCDPEAPLFAVTYEGCHAMNCGAVMDELSRRKGGGGVVSGGGGGKLGGGGKGGISGGGRGGGVGRWVEYDVKRRRGGVRDVRF